MEKLTTRTGKHSATLKTLGQKFCQGGTPLRRSPRHRTPPAALRPSAASACRQLRAARPPRTPLFLLFENSKAIADFDTKAVSKIDQTWRILARRRSVKSISWNDGGKSSDRIPPLRFNPGFVTAVAPSALRFNPGSRMFSQWSARSLEVAKQRTSALG